MQGGGHRIAGGASQRCHDLERRASQNADTEQPRSHEITKKKGLLRVFVLSWLRARHRRATYGFSAVGACSRSVCACAPTIARPIPFSGTTVRERIDSRPCKHQLRLRRRFTRLRRIVNVRELPSVGARDRHHARIVRTLPRRRTCRRAWSTFPQRRRTDTRHYLVVGPRDDALPTITNDVTNTSIPTTHRSLLLMTPHCSSAGRRLHSR